MRQLTTLEHQKSAQKSADLLRKAFLWGKVVRLKPDRMRSKVTASYRPVVMIGSFDLISQP